MRKIGVGTADFKVVRSQNNFLVDKTMLIHDVLDTAIEVFLFPRPRRFGKSLNISMLRYFFEKTTSSHLELFTDLDIAQVPEMIAHQGQYPVIDLSFKEVKNVKTWAEMERDFRVILSKEYERHFYLSDFLTGKNKRYFDTVKELEDSADFRFAILNLCQFLHEYHQQKVVLLIDEYDTPLNDAYLSGLLPEARAYISSLYGAALKGNPYLFKAVVTGIYRISKESIFSGLNNLTVCSILDNTASTRFGFTEAEMDAIFSEYQFTKEQEEEVTFWYNGYTWGNEHIVYNPWSIVNYLFNLKKLKAYWVNTSANDLIKELVNSSSVENKKDFEVLLQGGSIQKPIISNVVFDDLMRSEHAIWSFFFFSGYLNIIKQYSIDGAPYGDFKIVNHELKTIFKDSVDYWFDKSHTKTDLDYILDNLVKNKLQDFYFTFSDFIEKATSYYDFADKEPERVYHALVLGMMVNLQSKYKITSNRESGYGRYDIMLHPLQDKLPAYVFEFKKFDKRMNTTFEEVVSSAMVQLKENNYARTLQEEGHTNIFLIAIAFKGKEVKMAWEHL